MDVEEKKDAVVDGEKSAEQNPHDEVVANKDVPVSEQTQAEEGKPAAEESPMTEEVPVEAESSQQQEGSVAEENKATTRLRKINSRPMKVLRKKKVRTSK